MSFTNMLVIYFLLNNKVDNLKKNTKIQGVKKNLVFLETFISVSLKDFSGILQFFCYDCESFFFELVRYGN